MPSKYATRNYYSKEKLEAMPIIVLHDVNKLHKLMSTIEYNPVDIYEDLVKTVPNEEGCDDQARYVLGTPDIQLGGMPDFGEPSPESSAVLASI